MADLCLDRNYLSINRVESLYSYELLMALLLHDRSPPMIRAPACKMVRCVYVDRSPHVRVKFPRLIRFGQHAVMEREVVSPVKFALVEQVIYDYISESLDIDNKCDEVSVEMIELLLSLISFEFYSTDSLLHDISAPLSEQLSRCRFIAHAQDDDSCRETPSFSGSARIVPYTESAPMNSSLSEASNAVSTFKSADKMDAVNRNIRWEETVLRTTESVTYNIVILILIIVSVAVVIFNLLPDKNWPTTELAVLRVDRIVSILFIMDLTIRIYTNFVVNNEFASFFTELYKLIDVIVVSCSFYEMYNNLIRCIIADRN